MSRARTWEVISRDQKVIYRAGDAFLVQLPLSLFGLIFFGITRKNGSPAPWLYFEIILSWACLSVLGLLYCSMDREWIGREIALKSALDHYEKNRHYRIDFLAQGDEGCDFYAVDHAATLLGAIGKADAYVQIAVRDGVVGKCRIVRVYEHEEVVSEDEIKAFRYPSD